LEFRLLAGLFVGEHDLRRRRLEVATVRYDAGRFGRGYKPRPKSTVGIRSIPSPAWSSRSCAGAARRTGPYFCSPMRPATACGTPTCGAAPGQGACHLLSLDLRGPHDLRHTFATCLEDDGTTTRVIDELMGHAATRRSSWAAEEMSAMGAVYRHTTTAMEARVLKALDIRLAEAVAVIEASG
jgi:hypothetical protein